MTLTLRTPAGPLEFKTDVIQGGALPDRIVDITGGRQVYPPMAAAAASETAATGGASNPATILGGTWYYGLLEEISEYQHDTKNQDSVIELKFDCVDATWVERNTDAIDRFYPPGVDEAPEPSVVHLYTRTLEESRDRIDQGLVYDFLTNLHRGDYTAANSEHKAAIGTLQSEDKAFPKILVHARAGEIDIDLEGDRRKLDHRWHMLCVVDAESASMGVPIVQIDRDVDPGTWTYDASPTGRLLFLLTLDDLQDKRLARIFSLDFLPDVDLRPPSDGAELILLPDGNPPSGAGSGPLGEKPPSPLYPDPYQRDETMFPILYPYAVTVDLEAFELKNRVSTFKRRRVDETEFEVAFNTDEDIAQGAAYPGSSEDAVVPEDERGAAYPNRGEDAVVPKGGDVWSSGVPLPNPGEMRTAFPGDVTSWDGQDVFYYSSDDEETVVEEDEDAALEGEDTEEDL